MTSWMEKAVNIRYSGAFPKGEEISGLVQHTDLVRTLLELLDIEVEEGFDGKSIFPLMQGQVYRLHQAAYMEEAEVERKSAIRTNSYKYILSPSEDEAICRICERVHGGINELHDLNKDPGGNVNIIAKKPDIAIEMRTLLAKLVQAIEHRKESAHRTLVSRRIRDLKRTRKI